MAPAPEVIRYCNKLEQFSTVRHELGHYHSVGVAGRYAPAPGRPLLLRAVAAVVLQQPQLRVGIVGECEDETALVYVPSIDFGRQVRFEEVSGEGEQYDSSVLRMLGSQHDQRFPDIATRPPWTVIVCKPAAASPAGAAASDFADVLFLYHHALGDGMSGAIFHECLRDALNVPPDTLPELGPGNVLSLPDKPPAVPDLCEAVDLRSSWRYLLAQLWDYLVPARLRPGRSSPAAWGCGPVDLTRPRKTLIRAFVLRPAVVADLISGCRAHGITLTALIQALAAASFSRRVPAETAQALVSCTTMSMRRWVRPSFPGDIDKTIVDVPTSTEHRFEPDVLAAIRRGDGGTADRSVWRTGGRVKAELDAKIRRLPWDDDKGLMAYWPSARKLVEQFATQGRPRRSAWEVGNLTTVAAGEGTYRLTRAMFTQTAFPPMTPLGILAVGIKGGETTMSFTWSEGDVDGELVEGVARDLETWAENWHEKRTFGIGKGGE